jgi:nucleoside 2-deoxyribosyltransferase
MKIFASGPLRRTLDESGKMDKKYVDKIKKLRMFLEAKGHDVFIPHEVDDFYKSFNPVNVVKTDYKEIRNADLMIIYPDYPPSGGACVELGWATGWAKRVILLLKRDKDYSSLIKGISELNRVIIIGYSNNDQGFGKLEKILASY